jgi:hypothetical protein
MTGPTGAKGDTGPTGPTGASGAKGDTGTINPNSDIICASLMTNTGAVNTATINVSGEITSDDVFTSSTTHFTATNLSISIKYLGNYSLTL